MFFPLNFLIGIILAIIYCWIFFKLTLPKWVKRKLLVYAITIQISFLTFFLYSLHFTSSLVLGSNEKFRRFEIFSYGLIFFYFLIYVPLFLALAYVIYKKVMSLLDYSLLTRYLVILISLSLIFGLLFLGFYVFIFFFYGFAP